MNEISRRPVPHLVAAMMLAGGATVFHSTPASSDSATGNEAARCAALVGTEAGGARIESARFVAEATKLAPLNVPARDAFCQVRATISPAPTSKINVEVWLPRRWNNKLLGLGGSGLSGGLALAPLTFPKPVGEGYATMATDAGHDNSDRALWALNQPERIIDYGYRATQLGTEIAKALIVRYYETPARGSYFAGCSNGGRDALMLAQRSPDAYDGIIAGAPANNFVSLITSFSSYRSMVESLPADSLTPKMAFLHEAVLKKCDAIDGLKDGMVSDPRSCRFDPAELRCKSGQDPESCLSSAEVHVIRTMYKGSRTRDGRLIHPGLPIGSEYLWTDWWTKPKSTGGNFPPDFFAYFVHDDPNWTMASFQLDRDWAAAKRKLSGTLDATDTDLRPFARTGGKLIIYQGWDDQAVSPYNTIDYFKASQRKLGALADSARLFMVPGMGHCFDGNGLTTANFVGEIDRWVESGNAPDQIIAERPPNIMLSVLGVSASPVMTRPLCAWPKSARYLGTGSPNEAGSFSCQ